MKTIEFRIVLVGILFFVSVITGIWLSKKGRPLINLIFSFHKITALIAIVFTVLQICRIPKSIEFSNNEIILSVVTVILLLLVFITGGLLSFDKFANKTVTLIHKVGAFLVTIATPIVIYLLIH